MKVQQRKPHKRARPVITDLECEKCHHQMKLRVQVIKDSTKNDNEKKIISEPEKPSCFPLAILLTHNGFWITENGQHQAIPDEKCRNSNSVVLDPTCLLYIWKLALRHKLISLKVIEEADIDAPNLVPHVKIRENYNSGFAAYQEINKKIFLLSKSDFSLKKDFLTIELDRKKNWHCTMIYSKGIGKQTNGFNLMEAFEETVTLLNRSPKLIQEYSALPHFGKDALRYWVSTSDQFPNNIIPPEDWEPVVLESDTQPFPNTLPGGTIVQEE